MPNYYVNRNAQENGDHEVHDAAGCPYPPNVENRLDLGWHADCHAAVREAKRHYQQSNGCYWCCRECHTN